MSLPLLQWTAPEVRAGSEATGRVATVESDVYMVGGLAYELLTGGTTPFHWLLGNPQLLAQRLVSADPVEIPDCPPVPGLLRLNVLEALAEGKRSAPWCVQANGTPGSAGRLEELKGLVGECLAGELGARPKLPTLLATLEDLERREVAEVREVGSPGGGFVSDRDGPVSSLLPVRSTTTSPADVPMLPVQPTSFKRRDVLDALVAEGVSADLQDAVARGLAGSRVIAGDRLAAVLRQAGVPDRLALRVEDRLVSGVRCSCCIC